MNAWQKRHRAERYEWNLKQNTTASGADEVIGQMCADQRAGRFQSSGWREACQRPRLETKHQDRKDKTRDTGKQEGRERPTANPEKTLPVAAKLLRPDWCRNVAI